MFIHILPGQPDECCQEFFNTHWPKVNEELFGWTDQERWRKEYKTLWIKDDEGVVAAALMWTMGGVGYLSQLLVEPGCRGKGLGRQLMAAFEQECNDCHKLSLKTYKDSASQNFYEGQGYIVEAVLEKDIHGIDWVFMAKEGWVSEG